ncbi:MAG: cell surface protein SprA [Saprospiraceae bacterium]|nr:cell surface protein SprA [Saprospiraceae bacterium]
MTKRNSLLVAIGVFSLGAFYAFTNAESVRDSVLTVFYPDATPSIAPVLPIAKDQKAIKSTLATPVVDKSFSPDTLPPLEDRYNDFINEGNSNPFDLRDPKVIKQEVEYDPISNRYIISEKIGEDFYRSPTYMTFEEYVRWRDRKQQQEYFDRLQGVASGKGSANGTEDPIAKFNIKNSLIDRLFGGTNVDIKPSGNINLTFGYNWQNTQNPILTQRQQRNGNFDFDMDINMSAQGKIGEKLNLNFNYNTQATFDFDNQMKLHYDPKSFSEDEIIQNVEAGNVSLPLRSNLIKGVQNLFGLKLEFKTGHLRTTVVAAQQRSRQNSLTVQGGAQVQSFSKPIDEYDENRHFFVSHWNRDGFETALNCLPVPISLFTITRMEVWITNDKNVTENFRDVVAITDLGEPVPFLQGQVDSAYSLNPVANVKLPGNPPLYPHRDINNKPLPDNENNRLYPDILNDLQGNPSLRYTDRVVNYMNAQGYRQIRDFEKVSARLLSPSEYTYNEQLGFISINLNVQPDQTVGVAMEYTYNGQPHKVGEFSSDIPRTLDSINNNVLFVKMLKSTTANVRYPIWDLMMKNVYAIGATNVDPQEFRFDIVYEDPGKGQKRFLDGDVPPSLKQRPLLQVFGLDNLNLQGDPGADGIFDYVPGLTINLRSGRVMFPKLEPFGAFLKDAILTAPGGTEDQAKKLIYPQLYDSTLFRAREFQELNRFTLKGQYKSSSSAEISLGAFNLPKGSVKVSAGGQQLKEGVDYQVDYNIGKVKILNDGILQSGQNVNVSFEDNTLFGFQNRTMLGTRFDYAYSKDLNFGATFMNLYERPLTQKVNFGDDPINNKVYGFDFNMSKDAPWLTKALDKLPLIQTKEASSIVAQAEVAILDPGYNKAINPGSEKGGTVYIDDFEGTTANLPLTIPSNSWVIASVPQGDENLFPETTDTTIALGANRAGMSWYIADPSARDDIDAGDPYTSLIQYQDIFPNRQLTPLEQSSLRPLDITYYPRDRGPYNYERPDGYTRNGSKISNGLTEKGELNLPETRWGGIMRGLNTNDFEAANIEFIEFWVLNPYMDKKDGSAVSKDGTVYFDLGTISEDIMRDSRQYFENGIPTEANGSALANTRWGRVPVLTPVVNAFDNNPDRRPLQDLGLDGLNDEGERNYFSAWYNEIMNSPNISPNAKAAITQDPSNDNFVFFRDQQFDATKPGVLERYRSFNRQQGNSPVNDQANLNPSATNLPDGEDLNRDNSLNENEAYFRYPIKMKKGQNIIQTSPTTTAVVDGLDFINDPVLSELITDTVVFYRDGQYYVWYRFKMPLDYKQRQKIGGIQDFRSIRFIRMFWKGFTERTTFRFATLELGRNQWRRYTQQLKCESDDPKPSSIPFDVNAVSIEANSARTPFNYTIPYGIRREQSVGAFPDVLQNEQALSMSICSLGYCDAKAVFKSLNLDVRQYKRLKMFVHAEATDPQNFPLDSSDLKIFMRIGSDFVNNYYEYEIPLVPSRIDGLNGNRNADSREYKEEVWKPVNDFDFPLDLLIDVKTKRNLTPGWPNNQPYEIVDPEHPNNKVRVVGNPNLGYAKGVMVGVRNLDEDQSRQHCVEVWLNELRLNGFSEKGGVAAQAKVDVKLADIGNLSLAGSFTSQGWGSIEQKINQRQREDVLQLDASTNLELHKFLPDKWGIRIPFYAQYSSITRTPEFDPYDLDIKLRDKLRNETDAGKRDSIRNSAQDVTVVRGYNFTNVRKERKAGKKVSLPWDISNFSFSYAFNQTTKHTPFILNDKLNQYKGGIDYQYSTGLKPFTPFKKLIKNDKYLKFISEFNLNPIPNTYGFSTNLERFAGETTYRFAGEDPKLNTYFNRRFTWERNYDLGWDIAKSLRFSFDATARSLIDEPYGFDNDGNVLSKGAVRDSIWKNILKLGRPKSYNHNLSLNYTLPFKSIPFMDFISMKASYTGGYTWTAQSLKLQNLDAPSYENEVNARSLGNVIQNNSVRQINGEFDFVKLYDKSKYLSKINKPAKAGGKSKAVPGGKGGKDPANPKSGGNLPGGRDPGGKNNPIAGGKDPAAGKVPPGGNDDSIAGGGSKDRNDPNTTPPIPPDNSTPKNNQGAGVNSGGVIDPASGKPGANPKANTPGGKDPAGAADKDGKGKDSKGKDKGKNSKDKDKDKKEREPSMLERIALRPLMLVRKARFTYSETYSTVVPGFTPDSKLLGQSNGFEAPGWGFVAGVQPKSEWLDEAASNGWMTYRPELNQQVLRNYAQNMDGGVTLEPFPDFRIELNANRQYTRNNTELFKDQNFQLNPDSTDFQHRAQREFGSFSVSYFSMKTLFNNDINALFRRYEDYRPIVSNRLAEVLGNDDPHDNPNYPGYKKGYGGTQQEVLIPAFIAAYKEKDPGKVGLNLFDSRPDLNWKLNYNGLSKLGKLDKIFSSIQITHGYKNTLTVSTYNTDIFYEQSNPVKIDNLNYDYIARFEVPQVVINEQMQPLLGVDVKLKNDMTFKLDVKKSRTLALSLVDYQLAESRSTGYTFGFGYRVKNVNIPFLTGKKATAAAKKAKSKKKKKGAVTPPGAPGAPGAPAGGPTQGNDLNFKCDFDYRDEVTVNHRLDIPGDAIPTRGARTIALNPSVEYAINKRLTLRMFTDYRKTVPKTSQSFPITTIRSGVTVQFKLN